VDRVHSSSYSCPNDLLYIYSNIGIFMDEPLWDIELDIISVVVNVKRNSDESTCFLFCRKYYFIVFVQNNFG